MQLSEKRNPVRTEATIRQVLPGLKMRQALHSTNPNRRWKFTQAAPQLLVTLKTSTKTSTIFGTTGHRFPTPGNGSWLVGSCNRKLLTLRSTNSSISDWMPNSLESVRVNPHLRCGIQWSKLLGRRPCGNRAQSAQITPERSTSTTATRSTAPNI